MEERYNLFITGFTEYSYPSKSPCDQLRSFPIYNILRVAQVNPVITRFIWAAPRKFADARRFDIRRGMTVAQSGPSDISLIECPLFYHKVEMIL